MFEMHDKISFKFQGEKYRGEIIDIGKDFYEVEMARGVTMIIGKEWVI